jgi:hypothetical protein
MGDAPGTDVGGGRRVGNLVDVEGGGRLFGAGVNAGAETRGSSHGGRVGIRTRDAIAAGIFRPWALARRQFNGVRRHGGKTCGGVF